MRVDQPSRRAFDRARRAFKYGYAREVGRVGGQELWMASNLLFLKQELEDGREIFIYDGKGR